MVVTITVRPSKAVLSACSISLAEGWSATWIKEVLSALPSPRPALVSMTSHLSVGLSGSSLAESLTSVMEGCGWQKAKTAQIRRFGRESLQGIDFALVIHKLGWHIYVLPF